MEPISKRVVAITGAGCVLPGSPTIEAYWQRLVSGCSAITPYRDRHIDSTIISNFGGVDDEQHAAALDALPFKLRRYGTPCSQWSVKASADAFASARLDIGTIPDERRGIFTAQGDYMYPSLPSFTAGVAAALHKRSLDIGTLTHEFMHLRGVDPFFVIKCLANNLLAITSLAFEMRGDCGAFVQDDSAVIAALRSAVFSLRHGYCDVALLVCAGSYNEAMTFAEMRQLGHLSECRDGAASLRPFDLRSDGAILGEGAIAMVLETAEHAQQRGVRPLAAVSGIGCAIDMGGATGNANPYRHCVQQAVCAAGIAPADIDAIVATGRGSVRHDREELQMIESLPDLNPSLPVTCVTPITGSVPACPVKLLAAIAMLQHQQVPPIAHLEQPLATRLKLVQGNALHRPVRQVLTLTAGHTGSHSAILLSKPFD